MENDTAKMEQLIRDGRVLEVLRAIRERPSACAWLSDSRSIMEAIANASNREFHDYLGLLFESMVKVTGELVMLNQLVLTRRFRAIRTEISQGGPRNFAAEEVAEAMPPLLRLQNHVMKLISGYAQLTRALGDQESKQGRKKMVEKLVQETEALAASAAGRDSSRRRVANRKRKESRSAARTKAVADRRDRAGQPGRRWRRAAGDRSTVPSTSRVRRARAAAK